MDKKRLEAILGTNKDTSAPKLYQCTKCGKKMPESSRKLHEEKYCKPKDNE